VISQATKLTEAKAEAASEAAGRAAEVHATSALSGAAATVPFAVRELTRWCLWCVAACVMILPDLFVVHTGWLQHGVA